MQPLVYRAAVAATAALFPMLLLQGRRVRRSLPRAPIAQDAAEGATLSAPPAPSLRLLVIGGSTAAGVGVASHTHGLAAQTARALSERTARAARWRTLGQIGATAHASQNELSRVEAGAFDVVIVALA